MARQTRSDHPVAPADHAALAHVHTAFGVGVELMRTSFQTQAFPKHAHEYYTLGVVLRGVGTVWHRGAVHLAHRGDVVVIAPGEVHTGGVGRGFKTTLSYLATHVPAEVFRSPAGGPDTPREGVPDFARTIIHDRTIASALRKLDAFITPSPMHGADDLVVGARSDLPMDSADDILVGAIDLLVRRHSEVASDGAARAETTEPHVVRTAREIIDDCYMDTARTTLRALAMQVGVSPFHLVRAFTRAVGLAPHQYLVQTRVRRACDLLARGVGPSFVAAMTGFVDQSHLTTQFKRYIGTTPASYQQSIASRRAASRPGISM
jgi:AraC-like DNA-binding protein/quercetin dioxygenase-like cupin family protein